MAVLLVAADAVALLSHRSRHQQYLGQLG